MADSELEILIRMLADTQGADEVQKALDGVKDSTQDINTHLPEGADLWKKYKNILGESGVETEKLHASHKLLHFAMKQLGVEIPGLSLLLKGLFNPTTIAVVGLAGAWKLWNDRIEEGVNALAGMKLPDLSEHAHQLSVAAQNAKTYSEAIREVVTAYNSVDAASDRALKKIQQEYDAIIKLAKARGASPEEIANIERQRDRAEITAEKQRRDSLVHDAAQKRAQASTIKVASAETDEANLADAKAQADAAKESKSKSQEWINRIDSAKDSNIEAIKATWGFYKRYGVSVSGTEAKGIEQANIGQANEVIERYNKMLAEQSSRGDARSQRQKLLEEAGKEEGQARVITQSLPEDERSKALNRATETAANLIKTHPEIIGDGGAGAAAMLREVLHSTKRADEATIQLLQELIRDKGNLERAVSDLASRTDRPRQ